MVSTNSLLPRTVRTATIGIVLLVTLGMLCTAPVAGQSGTLVTDVDNQVSPDGTVSVTLTAEQDAGDLQLGGDTAGWTIVDMDPFNDFTVPSAFNKELPYESGDETWSSGTLDAGETWSLILAPPADASDGETYDFTVSNALDSTISDSFSVEIVEQGAEFAITSPTDGDTVSAMAGEDVFINTTVENVGSGTGDGSVALVVDGDQQDSASFTGVASGETTAAPLTGTAPGSAGTYDFSIEASPGDTVSGTIEVTEPESDPEPSSDYEVAPDGEVGVSFTTDQDGEITVSGDTDGWIITNMMPFNDFTAPSEFNEELPYESGDETWSSGNVDAGTPLNLTLEPPADAADGDSYEFDVVTKDLDGNTLAEETVSISVVDVSYDDLPEGVDTQTAAAVDANSDGTITLEEIVQANINRLNNEGEVDGVPVELGDIIRLNLWRLNN